ncbi:MAG: high-potential iron-sulfur protein [Pseudomonadales bacterium]
MSEKFAFERSIRRRVLLKGALAGSAALLARGSFAASGDPKLSVDDPQAQALGYVEDAAAVDVTKWPKKAGPDGDQQNCISCALYQAGADGWGGCGIFPGKQVAGAGWCNAWVPRG